MNNKSILYGWLTKIATIIVSFIIALITITWVALMIGVVLRFVYPFEWWTLIILAVFAMWILNIIYFILALPSLLIFLIKKRNNSLNITISVIYIIGLLVALATPWYAMDEVNLPKCIIAIVTDVLIITFYKRKISELFEKENEIIYE